MTGASEGIAGPAYDDLGAALRTATRALAAAGVESAQVDAVLLAAHLLGVEPGEVRRRAVLGARCPPGFAELVDLRAQRIPLQHLTGRAAFRHVELSVGPGVFVPRPETEVLAGLAIAEVRRRAVEGDRPVLVVDLCTGSGAVAAAVADEAPGALVWAVELSPEAHAYAARNLARWPEVTVVLGDAADPALSALADLAGGVDVVTCNPPYIPDGAVPIDPEVARHDPELALYGRSADGLAVPLRMAQRAAELLRPGGLLLMEHADTQGETLPAGLRRQGSWAAVEDLSDLSGRQRVTSARRG